jgi:DNA-binding NarL/FixJ family response regulator
MWAEAPDLLGEALHVDRLGEAAREMGVAKPLGVLLECERAEQDNGDRRSPRRGRQPPGRLGAVDVRQLQVHQDHIRKVFDGESDSRGAAGRLECPEAGCDEHVAGEPQIPLAVVDDQDEWCRHRSYCSRVPIRVVLADDHYLVREGVRRLLETESEIEVVAVCDNLESLLEAADVAQPDVVVTDIRMPPGSSDEGIQAAGRLRETHPAVGVVVLSQYANPSYALALLEHGSAGRAYLLKDRVEDLDQLVAAIHTVAEGGSVIDPKVVEALVAESGRSESSPLNQLTPREGDVLREMAEGKNNAAIAEALFLTERSVEKVIHSIFLKLDLTWEPAVHRRVKAVILYLAEGR